MDLDGGQIKIPKRELQYMFSGSAVLPVPRAQASGHADQPVAGGKDFDL